MRLAKSQAHQPFPFVRIYFLMRDRPQPLLWRLRPFLFLRRENLCFFLSERRLKGGVGVFPWGASGRQDGGFLRQNQHFSKPEEGGAGYGSFPHRKDRRLHGHVHLRDSGGPRELEAHGYLVRVRVRNENGQLGAIEYTILELPKEPAQKPVPVRENPIQVKPMSDAS